MKIEIYNRIITISCFSITGTTKRKMLENKVIRGGEEEKVKREAKKGEMMKKRKMEIEDANRYLELNHKYI